MKTLALISCTKLKEDHDCPAVQMYAKSDLFSKALRYCQKNFDEVMILSAKYGAIKLSDVISPYNETLNEKTKKQRAEWALQVYQKLKETDASQIFFFAGRKYREHLIPMLEGMRISVQVPLKGMGIGEQKKWLKKRSEKKK